MQREWWRNFGEIYIRGGEVARLDAEAEVEAEAAWKLLGLDAGARVVDAPCGFGRHAVRLAAWGFGVWGIDVDAALLDEARRRAAAVGVDAVFDEGDLRELPVPDGWADAVLNLASSVGLFASESDNSAVFDEAYRVLRPGGRILVETSHRDSVVTSAPVSEWSESPDGTLVLQRRRFDPVEGRLLQQFTIVGADGERLERHLRPRRYALTELAALMTASGFVDVEFHGGWRGEPVSVTNRVVALATRPHAH
ncbi:MAG: class I SAM-dependent methyltransferase [Acidimicrobiia bacterium]